MVKILEILTKFASKDWYVNIHNKAIQILYVIDDAFISNLYMHRRNYMIIVVGMPLLIRDKEWKQHSTAAVLLSF